MLGRIAFLPCLGRTVAIDRGPAGPLRRVDSIQSATISAPAPLAVCRGDWGQEQAYSACPGMRLQTAPAGHVLLLGVTQRAPRPAARAPTGRPGGKDGSRNI